MTGPYWAISLGDLVYICIDIYILVRLAYLVTSQMRYRIPKKAIYIVGIVLAVLKAIIGAPGIFFGDQTWDMNVAKFWGYLGGYPVKILVYVALGWWTATKTHSIMQSRWRRLHD